MIVDVDDAAPADPASARIGPARPFDPQLWSLPFAREIAAADAMALSATPRQYYHFGLAALDVIQTALAAAGFEREPRAVLDFACGHGRVLRMLVAAFPQAEVTACDVDRDGVDFCARKLGATPVYGDELAERVALPDRYELIWVGSLFTHLDAPRWSAFLSLLVAQLAPGGVLVFTTHGRRTIQELRTGERKFAIADVDALVAACDRDGFAYQNYTGQDGFGISLSRPSWVCAQLERIASVELILVAEGGWGGRQDAIACRAR